MQLRVENKIEPSQIVGEALTNTPAAALPLLNKRKMRQTIQRKNIREEAVPANPSNLRQLYPFHSVAP